MNGPYQILVGDVLDKLAEKRIGKAMNPSTYRDMKSTEPAPLWGIA